MSVDLPALELTEYAVAKLRRHVAQIVRCVRALDADALWRRATERNNSVGNLVLHLAGNVRQWIIGGVGGEPITRDRAGEFAERGPLPADAILDQLERTVAAACAIIARQDAAQLAERREIQTYDVSVLVAIMHVVEHFSWHTGQIVHMTKTLSDVDLSVYDSRGHRLDDDRRTP